MADYGYWYTDYTLVDPANVEEMRRVRPNERGIPVILFDDHILVGFDRQRLKTLLGLH